MKIGGASQEVMDPAQAVRASGKLSLGTPGQPKPSGHTVVLAPPVVAAPPAPAPARGSGCAGVPPVHEEQLDAAFRSLFPPQAEALTTNQNAGSSGQK